MVAPGAYPWPTELRHKADLVCELYDEIMKQSVRALGGDEAIKKAIGGMKQRCRTKLEDLKEACSEHIEKWARHKAEQVFTIDTAREYDRLSELVFQGKYHHIGEFFDRDPQGIGYKHAEEMLQFDDFMRQNDRIEPCVNALLSEGRDEAPTLAQIQQVTGSTGLFSGPGAQK